MGLLRQDVSTDAERDYYALTDRAFTFLAPWYDLIALAISGVRRLVVRMAESAPDMRVLDVATGTGTQAYAFARRGCKVTGVDISEAMLAVARRTRRHPNVQFALADATHLPYESGRFDICSISFALHDMPLFIRRRVLEEMVRVTVPGGRILVADYGLPGNPAWRRCVYHLARLYEADYYVDFIRSDLEALLEGAGIEVEDSRSSLLGAARVIRGRTPRAAGRRATTSVDLFN